MLLRMCGMLVVTPLTTNLQATHSTAQDYVEFHDMQHAPTVSSSSHQNMQGMLHLCQVTSHVLLPVGGPYTCAIE
jgi:hypothetical protein